VTSWKLEDGDLVTILDDSDPVNSMSYPVIGQLLLGGGLQTTMPGNTLTF